MGNIEIMNIVIFSSFYVLAYLHCNSLPHASCDPGVVRLPILAASSAQSTVTACSNCESGSCAERRASSRCSVLVNEGISWCGDTQRGRRHHTRAARPACCGRRQERTLRWPETLCRRLLYINYFRRVVEASQLYGRKLL